MVMPEAALLGDPGTEIYPTTENQSDYSKDIDKQKCYAVTV